MSNCVLIIPYFGKFPSWFQLFLDSCGRNPGYDWRIYTDDATAYEYPQNVQVIYTTFSETRDRFREKLGQDIQLERPYKFCDYKPSYGHVYAQEIQDYDWWGHCDLDLLFGDLERFVSPLLEKGYDKIFAAGHLTIYRNTPENNMRYLLPLEDEELFHIYSTREANAGFDEDGGNEKNIHAIYMEHGFPVYAQDLSFNCSDKYYLFRQCCFCPQTRRWYILRRKRSAWFWHEGKVLQLTPGKEGVEQQEYAYMHLQGRKWMRLLGGEKSNTLWIRPDGFRYCKTLPETKSQVKRYLVDFGGIQGLRMVMLRMRLRLGRLKIRLKEWLK